MRVNSYFLLPLSDRRGVSKLQKTSEPKSEDAPDNLFGSISGFNRVEGDFSKQLRANSYSTWLETHPTAKWGAIAVTVREPSG